MPVPKGGHIEVIEAIAKGLEAEGNNSGYLELGCAKLACFNRICGCFEYSVGVDIEENQEFIDWVEILSSFLIPKPIRFYSKGTDSFFKENTKKFNLIFIDADHHYVNVKKDFINSFKVLKKNGLIILHDTWPDSKAYTKYCFDAHKITDDLNQDNFYVDEVGGFEYCTLPFHSGMTIVRKI